LRPNFVREGRTDIFEGAPRNPMEAQGNAQEFEAAHDRF
jgi:hypothetical protein